MFMLRQFEGFKVEAAAPRYHAPGRIPAWVVTSDGRIIGFTSIGDTVEDAGRRALDNAVTTAAGRAGELSHMDTDEGRAAVVVYQQMKAAYESYCAERKIQAYATWDAD